MANFSLIDYLFGLYININEGKNKFEVHNSKNGPKIANLRAKMSQLPPWRDAFIFACSFFRDESNGHNN